MKFVRSHWTNKRQKNRNNQKKTTENQRQTVVVQNIGFGENANVTKEDKSV